MSRWSGKRVLIVGGSAGLGWHIADAFSRAGAEVALAARDVACLESAAQTLAARYPMSAIETLSVDITDDGSIAQLASALESKWESLDVLVNAAGASDRGRIDQTSVDRFRKLLELNFLGPLRTIKALLPMLGKGASIVNIGSLAAKTASANLGAYPSSKFPLSALSQQLRIENDDLHVLLVCPGPIRRDDAGQRYQAEDVPKNALRPGGGVHLRQIDPQWLAAKIVRGVERRQPEIIVPAKSRVLFAISALSARLGDWIVRRMTS